MASCSKESITTMGGLTIVPDCLVEDIPLDKATALLLPGATTWSAPEHVAIIEKANALLSLGGLVGAICGATAALASTGLFDNREHTSNGVGFLEMVCSTYKGQNFYIDTPSVMDQNLVTASSAGSLLWAKQIIEYLDVFRSDTLDFWYNYFATGSPEDFFSLMQTLPPTNG